MFEWLLIFLKPAYIARLDMDGFLCARELVAELQQVRHSSSFSPRLRGARCGEGAWAVRGVPRLARARAQTHTL